MPRFFFHIEDGSAHDADQVMMRPVIHLDAQRTMMKADFPENAALDEQVEVLVHRGKRNGRNAFAHNVIHFLGAGMTLKTAHYLVEDLALVRHRDTGARAQLAKLQAFPVRHHSSY